MRRWTLSLWFTLAAVPPVAAQSGNPVVVCGDEERVHAPRVFDAPIDVLDHRPAANDGQGFAREAGRPIPRGDESDDSSRRTDEACQP